MSASNNPLFDFSTGDELSGVVPELIVLSSREQGWKGLELVQFRENLKELAVPPLSSHVIIFGIENSHSIRAKIGESVYEGYLHPNNATIVPAGVSSEWFCSEQKETNAISLYLQPKFVL